MPSVTHEALVELFKNRPTLAAEMLQDALGQPVPAFTEARVESSDLTEVMPSDRRADVIVVLLVGEQQRPAMAIVVEVQLGVIRTSRTSGRCTSPRPGPGTAARRGC